MSVRVRRLTEVVATRLWPTIVGFSVLALAAMALNQPGRYVGDNRFDQFWNPGRRAARQFLAWDPQRGLGREREDFWPGVTWPLAWLRGVGIDPAVTQHLWHAVILAATAVGMVAVLRLVRPRIGPEHLVAGTVAAFGAYSATFLVPSNLAVNFALAPWLIVIFVRGVVAVERWRWAAAFALVVFVAGNADLPGLVLAATPLGAVALYLVLVERTARWRDVAGWGVRAGVLSLGAAAAALTKVWLASGPFSQRLGGTELPTVSSSTSAWAETLRGLGHWRSYFTDVLGPSIPQGLPYIRNPVVVAATFAIPLVALAYLALSSWRPRLLFGLMILVSAVLMVAAFPLGDPSPAGRGILSALTDVEVLGALRNTYKAGAGLVLGSSALFGLGVAAVLGWLAERRRLLAAGFALGVAGVVALAAFPFWSGRLYDPRATLDTVPAYWDDAFAYLDEVERTGPTGAVLVLPGGGRTPYRWGWPGDDLYEARTDRPVVERIGVPLSAPLPANLVDALALAANDPAHQPGTLGPALRRAGITHVVVRNDVAWGGRVGPRPAAYAGLRADPDLVLAATFGAPGENTTAPEDDSTLAAVERTLPPVEIYEVPGAEGGVTAPATLPPLVVSGDGAAWVPLAAAGALDADRPVLYSAGATDAQLVDVLTAGGAVVVTDTNRRQLRVQIGFDPDRSYLLADDQPLDRQVIGLFDTPGSESVAWFPDALSVASDGPPRSTLGTQAWIRPANATDGDPTTEWIASVFEGPLRRTLTVTLREPTEVASVRLREARTADEPFLTGATVGFSDGSTVEVPMTAGVGELSFPPRVTEWVTVRANELPEVDGVPLQPLGLGFAEIAIGDLDLREFVQVPDDLARRAEGDAALAAALAEAPVRFLFTRETGSAFIDPTAPELASDPVRNQLETALRRRYRTPVAATWSLEATVRADALAAAADRNPTTQPRTGEPDCVDIGLRSDRQPVAVRQLGAAPPAGDGGARVRVAACVPLELDAGWHLLVAERASGVDGVELRSGPPLGATVAPVVELDVDDGGIEPTGFSALVAAPDGGVVSIGQGWDPRWRATLDGVDLGAPLALDTLAAWVVPPTDGAELRVSFGPTRWLAAGLVVTALAVALCLWLVLRRPPASLAATGSGGSRALLDDPGSRARPPAGEGAGHWRADVAVVAAVALASWFVAGWWALPAVLVAAVVVPWRRALVASALALGAVAGLALAAAVSVRNALPGRFVVLSPGAPVNEWAVTGGRVAGGFLVAALIVAAVVERAPQGGPRPVALRWSERLRAVAARCRVLVGSWWSVATVAALTAVGVVWRGRSGLADAALTAAAADVARGFDPSFGAAATLGGDPRVVVAPLGPVLAALAPLPPVWLAAVVAAIGVVVAARVGQRVATGLGHPHAVWRWSTGAAGGAGVAMVVLAPSLPWLVAVVALTGTALAVDPERLDGRRAVAAGVSGAVAVLAVPASVAVLAGLVAWAVLGRRRRWAMAVVLVAAAVVAPWVVWAGASVGWSGVSTAWLWGAGSGLAAVVVLVAVGVAIAAGATVATRRARPGATRGRQ